MAIRILVLVEKYFLFQILVVTKSNGARDPARR